MAAKRTGISPIQRLRRMWAHDRAMLRLDPAFEGPGTLRLPLPGAVAADSCPGRTLRAVGFDEAGRGALAGPIAVGCVHFDAAFLEDRAALEKALIGLDDSKEVPLARREALFREITRAATWSVGYASAIEIDRWGIVDAARRASARAWARLVLAAEAAGRTARFDLGLFDRGLSLRRGSGEDTAALPEVAITHGDATSLHIAAASIIAKVSRDQVLARLDARFAGYGLAQHKGYGTAAHRAAIERLGGCVLHRRTFLGNLTAARPRCR